MGLALAACCIVIGWCGRGWFEHMPDRIVRWRYAHLRRLWRKLLHGDCGGRPPLSPVTIELIRRLRLENPLWGAPRICRELKKTDEKVSQSSVSRYMIKRRGRPHQGWKTFLQNHKD